MTIVDGVLLQLIVTEEGNNFSGGVLELTIVIVLWNGLWEGSVNYAKTMSWWKDNLCKSWYWYNCELYQSKINSYMHSIPTKTMHITFKWIVVNRINPLIKTTMLSIIHQNHMSVYFLSSWQKYGKITNKAFMGCFCVLGLVHMHIKE